MTTRKDFLAAGAALSALAPQIAMAAGASPAATPTPIPMPPLQFDLAAFDASLSKAAKHKNLFTSKKIAAGEVFEQINGAIFAYDAIGVALGDVSIACVLYHGISTLMAFDDTIWQKYVIPLAASKDPKISEVTADVTSAKAHDGNPLFHRSQNKDDASIEALIDKVGMRLYVCNRAIQGVARLLAHSQKLDPIAVYKDLAAHLVPNAMLVPAGVWGVHAVQERGFTLLQVN